MGFIPERLLMMMMMMMMMIRRIDTESCLPLNTSGYTTVVC